MNLIEELYMGHIDLQNKNFNSGTEYEKIYQKIVDQEGQIAYFLDGEQKEALDNLMELIHMRGALEEKERFVEGFKLGSRFILDIFLTPWHGTYGDILEKIEEAALLI